MQDLTWTFDDKEPRFRHEAWRKVFDEQIKSTPMSILVAADPMFALPLGEHVEHWQVWLGKEAIWERYSTISHIAVLEGEERTVSSFLSEPVGIWTNRTSSENISDSYGRAQQSGSRDKR